MSVTLMLGVAGFLAGVIFLIHVIFDDGGITEIAIEFGFIVFLAVSTFLVWSDLQKRAEEAKQSNEELIEELEKTEDQVRTALEEKYEDVVVLGIEETYKVKQKDYTVYKVLIENEIKQIMYTDDDGKVVELKDKDASKRE